MITENDLKVFTGTERHHKDYLNLNITDGVKFLMEKCFCGWLISDIASIYFCDKKIIESKENNTFFVVTLSTNPTLQTATLIFREDTDTPILYKQQYQFTDINNYFEGNEIKFYLIDGVLLLPSEY